MNQNHSCTAYFVQVPPPSRPSPQGMQFQGCSGSYLVIRGAWSNVANETGYRLLWHASPTETRELTVAANTTSYTISNLFTNSHSIARLYLWAYNAGGDIFLSDVNLFYKAILLSENAINDILAKREKGKIVLAREVLVMGKSSPKLAFAVWLLMFALIPYLLLRNPLSYLPVDGFIMLLVFTMILSLPVFIEILPPSLGRTHYIDQLLEDMYGTSPRDAVTDILKDYTVANDLIARQKWEKAHGDPVRRRKALEESLFAAVVASLVSFVLIVRFVPDMFYSITIPILFSFLFGYLAFLIAYAVSYILPLHIEMTK